MNIKLSQLCKSYEMKGEKTYWITLSIPLSWNIFPSVLILNALPNSVLKTQAKGLKHISLIYLA